MCDCSEKDSSLISISFTQFYFEILTSYQRALKLNMFVKSFFFDRMWVFTGAFVALNSAKRFRILEGVDCTP